jgi:hypothetical protein
MVTIYSCKEAPLTEIEKIRARTMMRNNRIFQSLGIGAIASMLRKSNDCPEGSTITSDAASAITQGESSDYNPRDDEVIDGEEVEDNVVKKNVKVQTLVLFGGVGVLGYVCFVFLSLYAYSFLISDLMLLSLLFI